MKKLNNKRQRPIIDGIQFDSLLESKVYQILKSHKGINGFRMQHPIPLKPKTKLFPSINWRCDFSLRTEKECLFIEAKGLPSSKLTKPENVNPSIREFKRNIKMLEWLSPDIFNGVVIVVNDNAHECHINSLKRTLKTRVIRLKELNQFLDFFI